MKTKNKPRKRVSHAIALQTITFISSALGLITALAWNEAIREYVDVFIKPYFAKGSGVLSLFIYAIFITAITVIFTIQMTKIASRLDSK